MSAREAWEVVTSAVNLGGFVSEAHKARYARACAIVEACVSEHEAGDAYFAHAYNMPTDPVASNWYKRKEELERAWRNAALAVRALERGEELTC